MALNVSVAIAADAGRYQQRSNLYFPIIEKRAGDGAQRGLETASEKRKGKTE